MEVPLWSNVLEKATLCFDLIGVIGNLIFFITISFKSVESKMTTFLLQHQCVLDGLICLIAFINFVQPVMWMTGNEAFDFFLCHVWHTQVPFWLLYFISVYNLILIASDRLCAVVYAAKYSDMQNKFKPIFILGIYTYCSVILLPYGLLQYSWSNGTCLAETGADKAIMANYMTVYTLLWFILSFAFPIVFFITVYSKIAWVLKQMRLNKVNCEENFRLASRQFTISTLIVTIIFILSLSFDSLYYVLSGTGVVVYNYHSPEQRIGTFLASFNSVANPYVYVITMKSMRKRVKSTLCYPCLQDRYNDETSMENVQETRN